MANNIYVFMKPVKSVGHYYAVGTIMTEDEFFNPENMRLPKIKVSEGYVQRLPEHLGVTLDSYNGQCAQAIENRLGIKGIAERIISAFVPPVVEEEESQEPIEPPAEVKVPPRATNPKVVSPLKKKQTDKV